MLGAAAAEAASSSNRSSKQQQQPQPQTKAAATATATPGAHLHGVVGRDLDGWQGPPVRAEQQLGEGVPVDPTDQWRPGRTDAWAAVRRGARGRGRENGEGGRAAVGETVILLHPPLP